LKHLATHVRYRIVILKSMSAKDAEFIEEYERQLPLMKWRPTPDVSEVLTTDPQICKDGDTVDSDARQEVEPEQDILPSDDDVADPVSEDVDVDVSPEVSPYKVATVTTPPKRSNDRGLRRKRNNQRNTDFLFINENMVELDTISVVVDKSHVHRGRIKPDNSVCRLIFDSNSGCGKSLIRTIRDEKWKRLPHMSRFEAELYHLFTGHVLVVGKNYTMVRVSSSGFNENVSEWMHDDDPHHHVARSLD